MPGHVSDYYTGWRRIDLNEVMKFSDLTPGLYKIRRKEYGGGRKSRSKTNEAHLLRVTGRGDSLTYYIDHDTIGQHPRNMNDLTEDYEVIAKIDGMPQIHNCRITVSFTDSAGDSYTWTVTNAWLLRDIFDTHTWLKQPFGFEPRRATKDKNERNKK